MSEAAQLAKIARENLASALNALQSNAHVPNELLDLAEPIAEAMGVLHRIERSQGAVLDGRDQALDLVRKTLNQLQTVNVHHPAVDVVMDAVASSLAKVHALTRLPAGSASQYAATDPAPQPVPAAIAAIPAPPAPLQPFGSPPPVQPQPFAPPQGGPFGAPPQGGPFGAPPQGQPFGAPPQAQPFGAPPQGGPFGAPPGPFGAPPQGQPFGAPPQAQPFSAQPQPQPFGAQPQPQPFGAQPQPQPFGAQPQPQPFGAQPQPQPFGAQPFGAPPPAQPFGAPPPAQPFGAPGAGSAYGAGGAAAPNVSAPQGFAPQPKLTPPAGVGLTQPLQANAFAQPSPQPQPQAPYAQPAQPAHAATAPLHNAPAAQPAAAPQPGRGPTPPAGTVDVELGTHSPSNFYKGLGGNDVIEHGGIFVATYKIPKIGSMVALRILMPGDYEFRANATVQWTREEASSAEPGFGARFTQITPEGRQLVYRYTRNREPLFYDDL